MSRFDGVEGSFGFLEGGSSGFEFHFGNCLVGGDDIDQPLGPVFGHQHFVLGRFGFAGPLRYFQQHLSSSSSSSMYQEIPISYQFFLKNFFLKFHEFFEF